MRFSRTPPWFVVWLGSCDLGWQQRPPAGSCYECGYVRFPRSSCWKLSGYESVPSASCLQWALREREREKYDQIVVKALMKHDFEKGI